MNVCIYVGFPHLLPCKENCFSNIDTFTLITAGGQAANAKENYDAEKAANADHLVVSAFYAQMGGFGNIF